MKHLIILSSIAAFTLLISCKHEPPILPANIISLVDFSLSRDTTVVGWYKETIQHSILEKMESKERLVVLPIDFNSETSSQELFKVDFSRNDYSNEFAGLQKDEIELQNHRDSIHSAVNQFNLAFETTRQKRAVLRGGTDIFGALKLCKKYIKPRCRNIVVIFSDMLQYTDKDKWNFEGHLNNADEIKQYLQNAEKIDLQDLQIIVLTGAQNDMHPDKYNVVKSFWEEYIAQSNGNLIDYSSGAVSKLEQLITQ